MFVAYCGICAVHWNFCGAVWHVMQCGTWCIVVCDAVWHVVQSAKCCRIARDEWHLLQTSVCNRVACVAKWHLVSVVFVAVWQQCGICECDICSSVAYVAV